MAFTALTGARDTTPVRDIFKRAFANIDLPYFHPHSFRKMLTIWAMDNCSQYEFKTISQNIGHEHAMTTYNSYGTINPHDQRKAILNIGQGKAKLHNVSIGDLLKEIERRSK